MSVIFHRPDEGRATIPLRELNRVINYFDIPDTAEIYGIDYIVLLTTLERDGSYSKRLEFLQSMEDLFNIIELCNNGCLADRLDIIWTSDLDIIKDKKFYPYLERPIIPSEDDKYM